MSAPEYPRPGVVGDEGPYMPPPELPEVGESPPRWPAWYGPVALLAGLVAYAMILIVVEGVLRSAGASTKGAGAADVLTVLQDVVFVATAVGFASMTARPRPWHFGLRGRPLGRTALWTLVGMCSYLAFLLAYNFAFHPHGKQTVTKDLGANNGTAALIGGALVVIVVVPICEELFFRGFFYRALRSRYNLWIAAAIDALVFGGVHYTGSGTLTVLPVLVALGFVFCLVYERTGTIYSTIALHSLNNTVAYGSGTHHGGPVSAAVGAAMLAALALAVVLTPPGGRARGSCRPV